jgi:hypothetical protein
MTDEQLIEESKYYRQVVGYSDWSGRCGVATEASPIKKATVAGDPSATNPQAERGGGRTDNQEPRQLQDECEGILRCAA